MNRVVKTCVAVLPVVALSVAPLTADVKTRDKSQVKLEGMLGRMAGMFGGKAVREGIVTTNAVKGTRKVEMNDTTGRIVDLGEEKVYELDVRKKTYTVTTFDELRRRLREAREKAERETPKEEQPQQQAGKPEKEVEIDVSVKETGQKKSIAGHDTREVVTTVTVREKGRTLEEGGGLVLTANSWMGPAVPAMKEIAEFELRYWKAIAPEAAGLSAEQMAALSALYPLLKQAMERMKTEGAKIEGTALATTSVLEAVKSKEQLEQQSQQSGGGGGLGGMLARRMMKKDNNPRATVFTITHETLEISTSVAPADLEIPVGFKEKK